MCGSDRARSLDATKRKQSGKNEKIVSVQARNHPPVKHQRHTCDAAAVRACATIRSAATKRASLADTAASAAEEATAKSKSPALRLVPNEGEEADEEEDEEGEEA